jgi:intracellular septation protein
MSLTLKHLKIVSYNKKYEGLTKFLYDYLPLIVFFICYKFSMVYDKLLFATMSMLLATFLAIIASFILIKKIPKVATFSAIILGFFCGLTLFFNDDYFIKIKQTIINLIFAIILIYGCYFKKPMLNYLLGEQIKMSFEDWQILSWRWAGFFIGLAMLNEIIWRNFSTDFWVQFKVFGMMTVSMVFTISQIPFILKSQAKFIKN